MGRACEPPLFVFLPSTSRSSRSNWSLIVCNASDGDVPLHRITVGDVPVLLTHQIKSTSQILDIISTRNVPQSHFFNSDKSAPNTVNKKSGISALLRICVDMCCQTSAHSHFLRDWKLSLAHLHNVVRDLDKSLRVVRPQVSHSTLQVSQVVLS